MGEVTFPVMLEELTSLSMAEVLVSVMLEELASNNRQQVDKKMEPVLEKLTTNFKSILEVLDNAESGLQVQDEITAVRESWEELKDKCKGIHDILVEWKALIDEASKSKRKVFSLTPCYRICSRQDMLRGFAVKIKLLNEALDSFTKPHFSLKIGTTKLGRPHTASTSDVTKVHRRTQEIDSLVNELLKDNKKPAPIPVISIVGMAGIGKTTLAHAVFNDDRLKTNFERIWVCVSGPFDKNRIVKEIRESLSPKLVLLAGSKEKSESPVEKKFLIILDDVWALDPSDSKHLKDSLESDFNEGILKSDSNKGRILVTTCKKDVAENIGTTNTILLETLSQEESWSLFRQLAIPEGKSEELNKKFENIGRKIANKCKGFPLAIKTLGSHLHSKEIEEWNNVADREMWELREVQEKIFPYLLSKMHDLSFKSRKIFSYCSIFPKDYEIEKNILIDLWMTRCYSREGQTKDAEFNSDGCIEELEMYSFLKNFTKNEFDGSIESFTMHDIMYDFAQFLSKHEWFSEDIDDFEESRVEFSCEKTQHLVLGLRRGELFPMHISSGEKIRSLVVRCDRYMNSMTLSKLFGDFPWLRRLYLSKCDLRVEKLPREIEKLIYLQYLDLSQNVWLKELPESLCGLRNLKTLNLNGCVALRKLPQGIGKLSKLRHLLNSCTYRSLRRLPKGIEKLVDLQTLKEFVVSRDGRGVKGGLKCLEKLKNLQGSLDILKLQNVAKKSDQVQVNLNNMEKLLSLRLDFGWEGEDSRLKGTEIDKIVKISEVLEAAPPNLNALGIYSYQGKTSSFNWTSLSKLRALTLDNCTNWKNLPPLGELLSLESLHISWMDSVENVGDEFLGTIEPEIIAFQNLKTLAFSQLAKWKDWIVGRSVMPSLESLSISFCNQLQLLPDYILQIPTLKKLEIKECSALQNLYEKQTGREWSKISHIPDVEV